MGAGAAPCVSPSQPAVTGPAPRSGSGPIAAGRFVPGTVLAGRYRIIGLLGRGGMGEVYRADDLMLAQPVALKFLPVDLSRDAGRLARFRDEVRTAREVSHPNVCRVYDIGEVAGDHFLSMEYIDGEDLASLLRRIGRLPQDKGVEIARQLCAGLAAAHDRGVLHRDLKPANVMIDGRGHVRLADFGLAGAAAGGADGAELAGTPAYMAPEQFQGVPASVRSDIYALGLVLYELFTGKPVVSGRTVAELARQHREQRPSSMTTLVGELDPAIEKAIGRCLEKDPVDRPASALSVSAALPGGDPLAAAIARGETPSPELVAAAGEIGFLPPLAGFGLVGVVVAGLIAMTFLFADTQVVRLVPMPRPPEVLRDRGRQVSQALGYPGLPAHVSSGFGHAQYMVHLERQGTFPRDQVRKGRPPVVLFWYRESPVPLRTSDFQTGGRVTPSDPAPVVPGMIEVVLDPMGRLRGFSVVPPEADKGAAIAPPTDWSPLFREAALDPATFTAATSEWTPPSFADTRVAWVGSYPEMPGTRVRLEAASLGGRIVYFRTIEPWTEHTRPSVPQRRWFNDVVVPVVFFALMGGAGLLAVRNARLGRGDRRGAFRVAFFLVGLVFVKGLIGSDVDASLNSILILVFYTLSRALLFAALFWVGYLALEPYVRRQWPHTLISWNRLLAGRWRDPLVGRDVLVGCALGVLAQVLFAVNAQLSNTPTDIETGSLDGLRFAVAVMFARSTEAVMLSTGVLLGLFFLTLLVRRRWIAVGLVTLFFGLNNAGGVVGNGLQVGVGAAIVGLLLFGLVRLGLLTLVASVLATNLTGSFALTFDTSHWYSALSYLVMGVVVGVALLALWRATPVRALVGKLLSE
jgi:serine/threonine-protein kinase